MSSISERVGALCVAAALATSAPLFSVQAAEPSAVELEAARKLFEDGVRQEEAGDWSAALATFRKVASVRSSPAVLFHLGLCLEKTGKLVEARSQFLAAGREAGTKPDSKAIAERANTHADALRKRIPSVILKPPSQNLTLAVTIDGQSIASALIGVEIPLDPGPHRIEARAAGYRVLTRDIELEERAVEHVQLTMIRAGNGADDPAPPSTRTRFGVLPWIVTGVAVAGLASAGVFYGLSAGEASRLESACPTATACSESERDSYDRGRSYTTAGNVLLLVGTVAGVSAITLFVLNREASPATATVSASPRGISFALTF